MVFAYDLSIGTSMRETALAKAKAHIDRELAVTQIKEIVGWV
jgi:hypothetical protein